MLSGRQAGSEPFHTILAIAPLFHLFSFRFVGPRRIINIFRHTSRVSEKCVLICSRGASTSFHSFDRRRAAERNVIGKGILLNVDSRQVSQYTRVISHFGTMHSGEAEDELWLAKEGILPIV